MSECAIIKPVSDALSTLTNPAEIMAYEAVLRDAARDFAEHATAESTERAYASAWRSFGAFTATLFPFISPPTRRPSPITWRPLLFAAGPRR